MPECGIHYFQQSCYWYSAQCTLQHTSNHIKSYSFIENWTVNQNTDVAFIKHQTKVQHKYKLQYWLQLASMLRLLKPLWDIEVTRSVQAKEKTNKQTDGWTNRRMQWRNLPTLSGGNWCTTRSLM